MGTNIEWCDETWILHRGCAKVSPGCAKCYAETMSKRLAAMSRADRAAGRDPGKKALYEKVVNDRGRFNGAVVFDSASLEIPLRWKKPRRIFVNSMSDLFHSEVTDQQLRQIFRVMERCPQHQFQVLTKRPRRMRECPIIVSHNVILGTSAEDQERLEERLPDLAKARSMNRFLSLEPLLGRIDLGAFLAASGPPSWAVPDQVIVGAESGRGARPMRLEWARQIRDDCRKWKIRFFMKQLCHNGRKIPFDDWPGDLKIREEIPMPLALDGGMPASQGELF